MWQPTQITLRTRLKPLLHGLALAPFLLLVYGLLSNSLGANPIETLTHNTGLWGLKFLLLTLSISPLLKITQVKWPMQFRRMLGLYSAFYVLLHVLVYLVFDQSLSLAYVLEDIQERPYITAGFVGLISLIPLAITSPLSIRRRMGRQWIKLHRLTYLVGIAAIVHLLWLTKADYGQAWVYGSLFTLLMIYRLPVFLRQRLPRIGLGR